MSGPGPFTLAELARHLGAKPVGTPDRLIEGVRPLDRAGPVHLSVLHKPGYVEQARVSDAGAILVSDPALLPGRDLLVSPEPYLALARVLALFHPTDRPPAGIHPTAVVAEGARIGEDVSIGPAAVVEKDVAIGRGTVVGAGCVIARGAVVGRDCLLHPRVVVQHGCVVGDRCILHPGAVIGGDGFGYATAGGVHHKVPQVGRAILEDDVEIGANSTVDRGSLGDTVVGRGTKIDNLVMVAHNVHLGEGCVLAAQTGISGSTRLGCGVMMGGQSGIADHLRIGDGAMIAAKAAVFKDVPGGEMCSGIPARPHRDWLRSQARVRRLEELDRRLRELDTKVARMVTGESEEGP